MHDRRADGRQAWWVHVLITVVLLLSELPVTLLAVATSGLVAVRSAAIGAALALPVLVVRSCPRAAAAGALAAGAASLVVDEPGTVRLAALSLPIVLYTWVAVRSRREVAGLAVVLAAGSLAWTARAGRGPALLLLPVAVFGFTWLLATVSATRRAYAVEVHDRLGRAEREREQLRELVTNRERAAIARDLHDVVAHAVSVMVLHAEGSLYAGAGRDSPATVRALATIGATGRDAMTDLRRVLGVLREGTGQAVDGTATEPLGIAPLTAAHTLVDLPQLLDRVGVPDLEVSWEVRGDLRSLPASLSAAAFRIVQEALTNVVKHAARPSRVHVRVVRSASSIRLEVVDRPHGGSAVAAASSTDGHGLVGLRERAAAFGGAAQVGPAEAGGWQVRVTLPVER